MRKIILLTLFGLTFTQTNISGMIQGEFTSDGNPYMMIGDVMCVNCVLQEGVEIIVAGPYRLNIIPENLSYINGTSQSPVIIRSINGASGSWYGINIESESNRTTNLWATHLHLSDAVDGILKGNHSYLELDNSIITNCSEDGITLEAQGSNNDVTGWKLKNNLIEDNETGIRIYGNQTSNVVAEIFNNTIVNNNNGIELQGANGGFSVYVNSNIVSFNNEYGIKSGQGYIDYQILRYNNFYSNSSGDLEFDYSIFNGLGDFGFESDEATNLNGHPSDVGMNIYSDPMFESDAFTLQETSPCIDAGDFLFTYDEDGTIADIGAYPFGFSINDAIYGCTYSNATNYNSDATIDDGSCEFAIMGDFNNDGQLNVLDIVSLVNEILN